MKKIIFVAGDKSGDLLAGKLCEKLKKIYREKLVIFSFAGSILAKHSLLLFNLVDHSVSGLWEAASQFFKFFRIFNYVLSEIRKIKPDLIILVDFPEFNLRLAKALNHQFKIFYYISPQIWAWRKKRIKAIKRYIDKMIVIFEFEKDIYLKNNIKVHYFGHPLLDIIPHASTASKNRIVFLPGSRKNEIRIHLPLVLSTKKILEKALKDYEFIVVRPPDIPSTFYPSQIKTCPHSYQILKESKFILTSSGSATLEATIMEIPFLIFYKLNRLSYLLLRKMVNINFIGMPNIIANKKVVEEFIQRKATPSNLAKYTLEVIQHPSKYEEVKKNLRKVKEILKPCHSLENTALFIGRELGL
ncbi:MAG: lipid-A-disaccharide synthase [Candidatus Omnitrophica bacterium 4484_70.1]|nr:MAG: lipid-A-disaccharide synthase [Candidatus Omnitrophica bacterium 4484_70.1]